MQHLVAILIAIVGAALLSVGTQLQNSGVQKTQHDSSGHAGSFNIRQLLGLLKAKRWVFGTLLLGAAIVVQLIALSMAPLMVVQPVGAIALVITAVLNARVQHVKLNSATIVSIACCVIGIIVFVTIAAFVAVDSELSSFQIGAVLVVLAVVLIIFAVVFFKVGKNGSPVLYILGAGVLYGFVATIAKTILARWQQGHLDWLTLLCLGGIVSASLLGGWFVQNAHTSGPPDLVVAGLTVIDPIVAVLIGIIILQEAQHGNWLTNVGFVVAGLLAVYGVFRLAKYHPQMDVDGRSPSEHAPDSSN